MENFASIDEVSTLWRKMTLDEQERCEVLIPIVCDSLRHEAIKVGKDLDAMIAETPTLKNVVKSVVVDVVARTLMTSTDSEPMTQMSESGLGYSFSGSFLVPGGGLFIKESELKRIGLKRQQVKVVSLWGDSEE